MSFNKSKGNMYPWCSHTWNVITGKCPHDCTYCYMRRFKLGPMWFNYKELRRNIGDGRTIFVGSSIDMWAKDIHVEWIQAILERCRTYNNEYLFQTKNPYRFHFFDQYPPKTIFGTTIESDIYYPHISKAPPPDERAEALSRLGPRRMVSIEPVLEFHLGGFLNMIERIKPAFVSIGADSKGYNLPEPRSADLANFIHELRTITEVKIKKNLHRLLDVKNK